MIYAIPFVGWLIGFFFHVSLAFPFWICWNALAPKFFYFLPSVYHHLGFWETVGLFVVISVLKFVFFPSLSSGSSASKDKDKD